MKCTNPHCNRDIPEVELWISYCCVICMDWDQLTRKSKSAKEHQAQKLHQDRKHTTQCNEAI